LLSFS